MAVRHILYILCMEKDEVYICLIIRMVCLFSLYFSLRGCWMMGKGKTSRVLKQSLETGNMEKTKQGSMETVARNTFHSMAPSPMDG